MKELKKPGQSVFRVRYSCSVHSFTKLVGIIHKLTYTIKKKNKKIPRQLEEVQSY